MTYKYEGMKKVAIILLLTIAGELIVAQAQEDHPARPQQEGQVIRLNPALDEIVPPDAKLEKLAGGFTYLEGGVWVRKGAYLIFSDIREKNTYKWNPVEGKTSIFLKNSASNGTTVDSQGRLVYCDMANRQIVRVDEDGQHIVLAKEFEGRPLNGPDDLIYRSDGVLYFSDINGPAEEADKAGGLNRFMMLKDGKLQILSQNLLHPNGVALSPDEKHLYIIDSKDAKLIYVFDVHPDGTISNGKLFMDMKTVIAPGKPDGMKVDQAGNVYAPGPRGLWIMSPTGEHLGTILMPEVMANLAFGDTDGKTLYLGGATTLYRIRLKIPGIVGIVPDR